MIESKIIYNENLRLGGVFCTYKSILKNITTIKWK